MSKKHHIPNDFFLPVNDMNDTEVQIKAPTELEPDPACRLLLERAGHIAADWGWSCPGMLSLIAAMAEPDVLEPLVEELTRGVLAPEEAVLLLSELRDRIGAALGRVASSGPPEPKEMEELLNYAQRLAVERQDGAVHSLDLTHALLLKALDLGAGTFSAAELVLLRRLLMGPRLAGAPPASRRHASIDLNDYRIRTELLDVLPAKLCRQHRILPLKRTGDTLYVASADPDAFNAYEDLAFWSGSRIELVRVTVASLEEAMTRHLPDESRVPEAGWKQQGLGGQKVSGAPEPTATPPVERPATSVPAAGPVDAEAVPGSFDRLQRLLDMEPQDHRYFGARGDLYMRIHYLQEAAQSYWKAAGIAEERGEHPWAVAYLRKLEEIHPSDRSIWRHLAQCFHAMGMHEELFEAFGTYADLSARVGEFEAALELYRQLTNRPAMDPELEQLLEQKAVRSYPNYLEILSGFLTLLKFHLGEPKSRDLYYMHVKLGLCCAALGFHDKAIAHYQKAVEHCAPKGHPLWSVGARALWEGDLDRAMEIFLLGLDEVHLSLRDRLHIQYDLAMCCEQRGDLFRAYQLLGDIRKVEEGFLATETVVRRLRQTLRL